MTTRSLFNIILKFIGLLFIRQIVGTLLSLLAYLWYMSEPELANPLLTLMSAVELTIYVLVAWIFVARSDRIVDMMKLHEGLGIDQIPINMHRSTMLSIALIVIGGLLLVEEIPNLIRQLYLYYQKTELGYGVHADMSPGILSAAKIIIGSLIIGNQRQLVSFIELNTRRPR